MTGISAVAVTVLATLAVLAAAAVAGLFGNWLCSHPGTPAERVRMLAATVDDPRALRGTGRRRKPTAGVTA